MKVQVKGTLDKVVCLVFATLWVLHVYLGLNLTVPFVALSTSVFIVRIALLMLYLSNRNLFDSVHDGKIPFVPDIKGWCYLMLITVPIDSVNILKFISKEIFKSLKVLLIVVICYSVGFYVTNACMLLLKGDM